MRYSELVEYLNTHIYGSWIDSNTDTIYEVRKRMGHIYTLEDTIIPAFLIAHPDETLPEDKHPASLYKWAFTKGFVRIDSYNFDNHKSLEMSGTRNALIKSWDTFVDNVKEAEKVTIDIRDYSGTLENEKTFFMPRDFRELQSFIKNRY